MVNANAQNTQEQEGQIRLYKETLGRSLPGFHFDRRNQDQLEKERNSSRTEAHTHHLSNTVEEMLCMAANGTGSQVLINGATADRSS